jgi:hypothetical protein
MTAAAKGAALAFGTFADALSPEAEVVALKRRSSPCGSPI